MSTYTLQGFTSDGESFDFPGVRFDALEAAVAYAFEYCRSVTGTDEVFEDWSGDEIQVRAIGDTYTETIKVREYV